MLLPWNTAGGLSTIFILISEKTTTLMQALTYSEPTRTLALQAERPLPVPGDAEVLIRVLRAGICSTVSNAMTGRVGHTPAWYICC